MSFIAMKKILLVIALFMAFAMTTQAQSWKNVLGKVASKVVEEVGRKDKQTQEIIAFNEHVRNDDRVENVILPLRDGINLIRVK